MESPKLEHYKHNYVHNKKGVIKLTVVKIVELIGSSTKSWEDAVKNTIKEAGKTIRNIKSVDVKSFTAKVDKNKIVEYRTVLKIAFIVERN